MMIDAYNDNTNCRTHFMSKKMEEEGLRTVECLRGRLQAERQASRTAKEEAELMSKKIAELEEHLKEEIKLREKAEKRLRFLMKKLESLKGSRNVNVEGSEPSSSSEVSAVSCVSSTDEDHEAKTKITNPDKTYDIDLQKDINSDQVAVNRPSVEEKSSLQVEDLASGEASMASNTSHEEPTTCDSRYFIELQ